MPKRLEGDFDYIVVGAGTRRLHRRQPAVGRSQKPRADPGGRRQRQLDLVSHPGRLSLRDRQSRAPTGCSRPSRKPGLNGRALAYPRGKVIGGSSAINAMISMRGQAADYDHWRQLGLDGLGLGRRASRRSGGWKIIFWARASITAPAAAGGSRRRGCPGKFSMRSAMPPEEMGMRKNSGFQYRRQ